MRSKKFTYDHSILVTKRPSWSLVVMRSICFHGVFSLIARQYNNLALDHSSFSHSLFLITYISLDALACSSRAVCFPGSTLASLLASRDANSEQTFTVILHNITRNLFSNNFLPRKFDGRSERTRTLRKNERATRNKTCRGAQISCDICGTRFCAVIWVKLDNRAMLVTICWNAEAEDLCA